MNKKEYKRKKSEKEDIIFLFNKQEKLMFQLQDLIAELNELKHLTKTMLNRQLEKDEEESKTQKKVNHHLGYIKYG